MFCYYLHVNLQNGWHCNLAVKHEDLLFYAKFVAKIVTTRLGNGDDVIYSRQKMMVSLASCLD